MKNKFTELVFIIDRSGSMNGLEDDTIGGFNAMLKQQKSVDGEAVVTTVLFDDQYELFHDRVDIHKAAPLTRKDYTARGTTALLDAIGRTIHNIRKAHQENGEKDHAEKVMFFILTDGQENASRRYTASMIQERIEHQKRKHGWEFLFFGANMDAIAEAAKIGIKADQAHNYCANSVGTASVYMSMSAVSTAFRTGNSIQPENLTDFVPRNPAPKSALRNLRKAMRGLKQSADGMVEVFTGLIKEVRVNNNKTADVNDILQKVFSEENDKEGSR